MRQSEVRWHLAVAAALSLLVTGCTKEEREAPLVPSPSGPATLSSMQADIFTLSCAISGCHDNRATPAGNLSLTSIQTTYNAIVNRNSTQAPSLKLIAPADPDHSYFLDKLMGVHLAVGGTGRRMPQDAAPLSAEDIDRVVTWINEGAPLN